MIKCKQFLYSMWISLSPLELWIRHGLQILMVPPRCRRNKILPWRGLYNAKGRCFQAINIIYVSIYPWLCVCRKSPCDKGASSKEKNMHILKAEKNDWVLFLPCYLHKGIFITQTFLELENSFHRFYPLKMTISNLFAFMSLAFIARYIRRGIVNYFSQILHNRWDMKWISWKLSTLEVLVCHNI